jgi:hypothetical protein
MSRSLFGSAGIECADTFYKHDNVNMILYGKVVSPAAIPG